MKIIDGKAVAQSIRSEIKNKVASLKRKPGLAFILIGDDPASQTYVKMKSKACAEVGFFSKNLYLPSDISEGKLLKTVAELNESDEIDGILIQQPFPPQLDQSKVISSIAPEKDVDGFHPINIGKILLGDDSGFAACTPLGIVVLLEKMGIPTEGKHVVIIGRSNIVGKPLAALLVQKKPHRDATVTLAHSSTKYLTEICKSADILIAAMGKPEFVDAEKVREGAVVIDVGINRVHDPIAGPKIVGDVHFDTVAPKCSFITPVPGGIGPMTIAMLLSNTLKSHLN